MADSCAHDSTCECGGQFCEGARWTPRGRNAILRHRTCLPVYGPRTGRLIEHPQDHRRWAIDVAWLAAGVAAGAGGGASPHHSTTIGAVRRPHLRPRPGRRVLPAQLPGALPARPRLAPRRIRPPTRLGPALQLQHRREQDRRKHDLRPAARRGRAASGRHR